MVVSTASAASAFSFTGRGWGHGLGMSQWGAKGLAENGWDSDRILRHYYSGTTVAGATMPGSIRVGLIQSASAIAATIEAGSANFAGSGGSVNATSGQIWRFEATPQGISVKHPDGTQVFASNTPVRLSYASTGGRVKLSQTNRYTRGVIDIEPNGSALRAVITLGIDEYLYGLGEMPSGWHSEALKVQAIAGRTYAVEKAQRLGQNRSGCNCAVYSSVIDQAYIGYDKEVASFDRWKAAVDSTSSRVVLHNGQLIQAFYFSSSGGHTENNENVWGGSPISYLRGVCDPGDYNRNLNPHNAWSVEMSAAELGPKLSAAGHNVGTPTSVDFLDPRGVSGRVIGVKSPSSGGVLVRGSSGEVRLSGSQFRSALALKTNFLGPHVHGAIRSHYDSLMCAPGIPRSAEHDFTYTNGTVKGRKQDFQKGMITWDSANAHWTYGAILAKYNEFRREQHDLGLPTTDEMTAAGGRASFFENGRIYWSDATQAKVVYGGILSRFVAEGGHQLWGLPTTDEVAAPGGRASYFQRAHVYWSPETNARIVYGAILSKYVELDGAERWGLPIADEVAVTNGRASHFQRARIYWSETTGAKMVYGAILSTYLDHGGPEGVLRLPTTDEIASGSGRVSKFQGGHIYWSPATGAHGTYGAILARYEATGGPAGSLGFPTSDEYDIEGGRRSNFQNGRISWNSATGEVTVTNNP